MTQLPPEQDPNATSQGQQPGETQSPYEQFDDPQQSAAQAGQPQPDYSHQSQPQFGQPQPGQPQPGYPHASYQEAGYAQPGYAQPGYAQPGFPQPGYAAAPAPQGPRPTNALAIVGFIAVFFVGLAGVILGHIALNQIKRSGEGGRGFALAATIIGYVRVGLSVLGTILFFLFMGTIGAFSASTDWSEEFNSDPFSEYEPGYSDSDYFDGWDAPAGERSDAEKEALCMAAFAPEVTVFDDPAAYFGNLREVAENPDLIDLLTDLESFAEAGDDVSGEELEQRAAAQVEWSLFSSELGQRCAADGLGTR